MSNKQDDLISASQIINNDENLNISQEHQLEAFENSTEVSINNNMSSRQSKYFKKRIASR